MLLRSLNGVWYPIHSTRSTRKTTCPILSLLGRECRVIRDSILLRHKQLLKDLAGRDNPARSAFSYILQQRESIELKKAMSTLEQNGWSTLCPIHDGILCRPSKLLAPDATIEAVLKWPSKQAPNEYLA